MNITIGLFLKQSIERFKILTIKNHEKNAAYEISCLLSFCSIFISTISLIVFTMGHATHSELIFITLSLNIPMFISGILVYYLMYMEEKNKPEDEPMATIFVESAFSQLR